MHRHLFILGIWLALSSHAQTPPNQQRQSSYSIALKTSYTDAYHFRGRTIDPDPAFQGDVTIGIGSWSYNLFHHSGSDFFEEAEEETTHSVEYTTVSQNQVRTTGYRYYDTDGTRPDTQEFFFRIAHQSFLHPSYGVNFDLEAFRGYYFDLSLSHALPLSRRLSAVFALEAGASVDMEEKTNREGQILEYGLFSEDGFNHASAEGGLTYIMGQRFKVSAKYVYHRAFDDLLEEDQLTQDTEQTWTASMTITLP